jgi:hypothetical protein
MPPAAAKGQRTVRPMVWPRERQWSEECVAAKAWSAGVHSDMAAYRVGGSTWHSTYLIERESEPRNNTLSFTIDAFFIFGTDRGTDRLSSVHCFSIEIGGLLANESVSRPIHVLYTGQRCARNVHDL